VKTFRRRFRRLTREAARLRAIPVVKAMDFRGRRVADAMVKE
jgi:hypothetical protein